MLFALLGSAFFSASAMIMPGYVPPINDGVFGQNQYYSVVYDGEGEAAVGAKLLIQNNGKEKIDSTIIEIPGTGIRMIRAVQEVYGKEQYCYKWDQVCVDEDEYSCTKYERQCDDWRWRSKTYEPAYYSLDPEEEELSESVKYTFKLEKPLGEQEQSAILLYYKVPKSAEKKFGVFNFKFETAKTPYDVNSVRVAVNTQEELYLKGGEAETQYRATYDTAFKEMSAPSEIGIQSKALSNFSNQITHTNGYTKTTSGLDPWESFTVEGKYAKSRATLYMGAIIGWVIGALAFLTGLGFLIRWLIRRSAKKRKLNSTSKINRPELLPLKIVGLGMGVAVGIIILIILSSLLFQIISSNIHYQYRSLIGLLIILLNGILVLASITGSSLYFGIKHGAIKGVLVLVTTITSLLILGIIVVIVFAIFQGGMTMRMY